MIAGARCERKRVGLRVNWGCPAQWLSWLECHPMHQKIVGSISGQGTYLGCGFDPWLGHIPRL